MKLPRIRLRTLLILIAVTAVLLAVVASRRMGRPHSSVFARFDPLTVLTARSGYTVQGFSGWNVYNPDWGYAYKEWRGVVTTPNDQLAPQAIQKSLEVYIAKVSQGKFHIEGTLAGDPNESPQYQRMPTHALFMFNEREWHGDLHVWLFPDSSGRIGYAIFLREERLK